MYFLCFLSLYFYNVSVSDINLSIIVTTIVSSALFRGKIYNNVLSRELQSSSSTTLYYYTFNFLINCILQVIVINIFRNHNLA